MNGAIFSEVGGDGNDGAIMTFKRDPHDSQHKIYSGSLLNIKQFELDVDEKCLKMKTIENVKTESN